MNDELSQRRYFHSQPMYGWNMTINSLQNSLVSLITPEQGLGEYKVLKDLVVKETNVPVS